MSDLEKEINNLIDVHAQLYDLEQVLPEGRTEYMRSLIEKELLNKGHSLKGIPNLSRKNKNWDEELNHGVFEDCGCKKCEKKRRE